ncbi:MAG: hypothetical protein KQI62_07180 [Deltaproteobacteria bacterium]|nr:hypothetical protein [Deltaproteobacteria bacterium]
MASLINSAWLILGCLGLGGLVLSLFRVPDQEANPYLYITTGTALIFSLGLMGVPFQVLVWLLYLGTACALWLAYQKRRLLSRRDASLYGLLLLLLIPLIIATLYSALRYWDARSIWFYYGKLMYFDHGLYSGKFPPPWCPAPAYPKFSGVFSALSASLGGLWNEYLPKAALMVPLAAMWLGVAGLSVRGWAKVAILAALVVLPGASLHGGYMDGWVAVFGALGHLYFIDYGLTRRNRSLACALVSLIFIAYFKNEGLPLAMISLAMMALASLMLRMKPAVKGIMPLVLMVLLALVPVVIWRLYLHLTGLQSPLFAGDVMGRIRVALDSGAAELIWQKLFMYTGAFWLWCASLVFNVGCYFLGRYWRCPFALSGRQYLLLSAPWLTSIFYAAVLFTIYLLTPADLNWHLATSAYRVIIASNLLLTLTLLLPILLPMERGADAAESMATSA